MADPGERFTPRAPLASNGLDRVVVKFEQFRSGHAVLVQVGTPNLSPSSALEVDRAFGDLLWKPSQRYGEPSETDVTLLFRLQH
ncbi:MAG TPA: hypothetical protein VMG32_06510 [Anaeromyxobacteraceae bacterium]|nr:hypothetical protein [Anaeromyxobacteraceae bacterium]